MQEHVQGRDMAPSSRVAAEEATTYMCLHGARSAPHNARAARVAVRTRTRARPNTQHIYVLLVLAKGPFPCCALVPVP